MDAELHAIITLLVFVAGVLFGNILTIREHNVKIYKAKETLKYARCLLELAEREYKEQQLNNKPGG